MWSLSDESLLAGLASGDPEPAAAFVRRFQARVFGLAFAIVGDSAVAEEVAQETFIRAWRYSGAYDPRRGRVAAWLLTIARNLAIDARRLQRADVLGPEALVSVPSTDPDPEERGLAADDALRLRRAIADLPPEQRRALVLAAYHGRTAAEVGEMEGIPLGTAKTRIRAAMMKLRDALEVGGER